MSNGTITAMIIRGPSSISQWRDLIGPTHYEKAKDVPESLRAKYGFSDTKNAFHGSDSVESAMREIEHFFPDHKFEEDSTIVKKQSKMGY